MRSAITAVLVLGACTCSAATMADAFRNPPDEARAMVRWWWFGPAVTKAGLEREMKLMRDGGFGGFEVQPVYPLTLDDPARGLINLRYLSPEFLDMVRFTGETARRLGLRMDMTLGSGWPFGGPHIPLELAAGRLHFERVPVDASATSLPLPALKPGERLVAAYLAPSEKSPLAPERLSLLPLVDDGRPRWLLPDSREPRSVLLFIA
ncbi:MAG: glycosyl hydrolase, partial [Bryobacteraceae bacterium]